MPKLDLASLMELKRAEEVGDFKSLRLKDFVDLSDRTLTVGPDFPHYGLQTYLHIYLQGKQLHLHRYYVFDSEIITITQMSSESIRFEKLQPFGLATPSATDYEFAVILMKRRCALLFSDFNTRVKPVDGPYFGWRSTVGFDKSIFDTTLSSDVARI